MGGRNVGPSRYVSVLFGVALCVSSCSSDGKLVGKGKKFDLGKTIMAVGGAAVAVVGVAACARTAGCGEGLAQGLSGNSGGDYFTGGPYWDWDQFSNGHFRCRDIDNGQFVASSLCSSMPRDDDRWPN